MEGLEKLNAAIEGINEKSAKIESNEVELKATKEALETAQTELKSVKDELVKNGTELEKLKEVKSSKVEQKSAFAEEFEKKSTEIKSFVTNGGKVELELKADATYNDLTQTGVLDQLAPGISDIVKKQPKVASLFSRIPMITETYTYLEQTSIVRDAQGVAGCAKSFTSLTKEEIGEQKVNYVKIKDTVDICKDYALDYGYVENRYRTILNDSIAFKIDTDLLLGTNSTTSTNSIDNVSSEFDPANVDAPIGANIPDANMADLILGMATQIDVLGKLGSFKSNVALVNKMDWFVQVESAKDANGNYLDPRISKVGGNTFVGDILVIPLVDVAANNLYVMDTTKGNILDRTSINLTMSDSNGTNFVDEYVTMMVTAKLQFLVENNNANAFMKCSDVATAIGAITKP